MTFGSDVIVSEYYHNFNACTFCGLIMIKGTGKVGKNTDFTLLLSSTIILVILTKNIPKRIIAPIEFPNKTLIDNEGARTYQ